MRLIYSTPLRRPNGMILATNSSLPRAQGARISYAMREPTSNSRPYQPESPARTSPQIPPTPRPYQPESPARTSPRIPPTPRAAPHRVLSQISNLKFQISNLNFYLFPKPSAPRLASVSPKTTQTAHRPNPRPPQVLAQSPKGLCHLMSPSILQDLRASNAVACRLATEFQQSRSPRDPAFTLSRLAPFSHFISPSNSSPPVPPIANQRRTHECPRAIPPPKVLTF